MLVREGNVLIVLVLLEDTVALVVLESVALDVLDSIVLVLLDDDPILRLTPELSHREFKALKACACSLLKQLLEMQSRRSLTKPEFAHRHPTSS